MRSLTVNDAIVLGDIMRAVQSGAKVARLTADGVLRGDARSVGNKSGDNARSDDDVRNCYVRVSLTTGFDAYWSVGNLMAEYLEGEFIINPA